MTRDGLAAWTSKIRAEAFRDQLAATVRDAGMLTTMEICRRLEIDDRSSSYAYGRVYAQLRVLEGRGIVARHRLDTRVAWVETDAAKAARWREIGGLDQLELAWRLPRACRSCGCTDEAACVVDGKPCSWVAEDLCSACGS